MNRAKLIFIMLLLIGCRVTTAAATRCETLATESDNGIVGNPEIKSATSAIVSGPGEKIAYCRVSLVYGTNPNQNINIVVGLPLNAADGVRVVYKARGTVGQRGWATAPVPGIWT